MVDSIYIGILVGGILNIMVYSILYKENAFFRLAEHILLGFAVGYIIVMGVGAIRSNAFTPIVNGNNLTIVPVIIGLLLLSRISPKISQLSRIPNAFLIGAGTGLAMRAIVQVQITDQIIASFPNLMTGTLFDKVNSLYIFIGTATSLLYFVFTETHGVIGTMRLRLSQIGRFVLMIGFGASFGSTVLTRVTLVSGRIQALLQMLGLLPM